MKIEVNYVPDACEPPPENCPDYAEHPADGCDGCDMTETCEVFKSIRNDFSFAVSKNAGKEIIEMLRRIMAFDEQSVYGSAQINVKVDGEYL